MCFKIEEDRSSESKKVGRIRPWTRKPPFGRSTGPHELWGKSVNEGIIQHTCMHIISHILKTATKAKSRNY